MREPIYVEYHNETYRYATRIMCDVCGKKIFDGRKIITSKPFFQVVLSYDIRKKENLKYHDVCGKECLKKLFDEFLEKEGESTFVSKFAAIEHHLFIDETDETPKDANYKEFTYL